MSDCLGSKKARPQNENAQQNQNGLQSQSERCALVQPRQILQNVLRHQDQVLETAKNRNKF